MSSQEGNLYYPSSNNTANALLWRDDARQQPNTPFFDQHTTNNYQYDPPLSQESNSYPMKQPHTQYHPVSEDTSYTHEPMIPSEHNAPLALRSTLASWAFELFATAVSLASIIAIIAVLYRENDRPLTAWTLAVNLNTVIATLGTVARSALAFAISACIGQQKWTWFRKKPDRLAAFERFDEASKGPLGGARLLFWLRLRHWASLGALVTIGTIAFDPFLQAVLGTYGRWDDTTATLNASIGYALQVDAGNEIESGRTGPTSQANTTEGVFNQVHSSIRTEFGLVSSIYAGFYNSSLSGTESTSFQCSTGNCTWPLYVSAAVCSRCEKLSSKFEIMSGYGRTNGSNVETQSNVDVSGSFTRFSLPYGEIKNWDAAFKKDYDWWQYTRYGAAGRARTFMTANTTYDPRSTVAFQDIDSLLLSFLMIRAGDDWLFNNVPWNQSKPIATECALYLCTNAYNTSTNNSVLQDRIVGSWAVRDPSSFQVQDDSLNSNMTRAKKFDASQGSKLYEPLINFKKSPLRLLVPDDAARQLNIAPTSVNFTQKFIKTLMANLMTVSDHSDTALPKRNRTQVRAFPELESPELMDALFNSTNITATFDNVAKSLTNQIRSASSERQIGTTQTWAMHVHVNWAYLAYPIGMLVMGITYVILTIADSMRWRLPVWKESALPGLLYGFSDETQRLLRETNSGGVSKAGDVRVRFAVDRDEKCMRLVAD